MEGIVFYVRDRLLRLRTRKDPLQIQRPKRPLVMLGWKDEGGKRLDQALLEGKEVMLRRGAVVRVTHIVMRSSN